MNNDQQSSLELLLDTITNTFGGILFLALLVVVLLQLTSEQAMQQPPEQETIENLATMETDLREAINRRDQLSQAVLLQNQLLKQLATESNRRDLETLRSTRQMREELDAQRLDLADDLVGTQNEINNLAITMGNLEQMLKIKRSEVDDASLKLEADVRSRTTTAKLPRLHATNKAEIAIVLRYGRIYFVHRYTASLSSREVNTDDMVVVQEQGDQLVTTPKPYAGIVVENADALRGQLRDRLHPFPPGSVYIAIAVWEDSFDKFIQFKNVLVELGYEYRVLPLERGDEVSESSNAVPRVQ